MAKLYFRVASDWEEVVRLRQEIDKLKATLKSMDSTQSPAAFKTLNNQLSEATKKMDGMVTEAAKAGAKIEGGFKKKIFDASQVVNGLSEKITLQRGVIQQLKNELAGLKDKYKEALKVDGDVNGIATRIKSVSARLSEQKAVLFGLTQQQAGARLNVKKLRDEYELYNNEGKEVNDTNESLALSWKKVIGVLGGVTALKAFVAEMVNVRGQFQDLEISFGTMLKSKEKADKLMAELVDIAAKTPFDLQGIASSAKQMLAYGSSVENVGKELVMLGNVAAGVGAQLGDIAYLYGTLRTQGRAYAVDIRQFAGRGIPIYEELAKVMGRNKDEISDLVSQGKVGFKEVEQAFQNMTKEGGMYFNLMENRSKSLTGQISNLGDAWDSMLNEMGKKGEGVFYTSISAAKELIENYEKVGMVIEGLIITYGAYKTALMVNIALEKTQAANRLASIKGVTAMKMATDLMTGSLARMNKVLMLNPYALVGASALASSVYLLKWADNQDKCTEASERFKRAEEASKQTREDRSKKVDEYIKIASDEKRATDERKAAIDALKDMYKGLIPQYDKESFLLKNIAEYKKKINEEELRNERIGTKTKLVMLDRDIAKYEAGLREASRQGAGQTAQSLMNIIKDLKSERVDYEKKLQQLESEASGSGAGAKEEKVKNKSYWEKQKKDAQAAIDAIDSISRKKLNAGNYAGVKKEDKNLYLESKKKIKEAEIQLKAYEEPTAKKDDSEKRLKDQERLNGQLLSLQRKNQQDEINLMAEGTEKKKAKADLDFQNALDTLESQEKEWRKAQNGKLTDEQKDELSKSEENAYKNYEKTIKEITKAKIDEDKRGWQEYYIAYGEYQEKRKAIEEKYNDELSKVEKDSPQYATLIAQRKEELDDLDETLMKDSGLWGDFFSDFSNRSSSAIKSLIVDIQKLIDYMKGVEGAQIPSIFKDDENVMKSINKAMSNPEAAQKFVKNLQGSLGKFKKMVEKDNPFELISKGFKEKDSKSLEDGFNGIAAAASELGNIMEGLGVKSDSALGKMTSAISGTASMAAQGAAIGGPWGAAIGAAIGLTTSLVGMFGADYSAYNNLKQEYEGLIDVWDTLISKKQKYIDIDYGDEARKVAEETKKLITDNEERYRELLRTLAASGSSKGSHSLGVRIDKRLSDDDYRRISEAIGQTVTNEYQFWELSAEQLEKLLQDPKLVSVLNTVNEDFVNYIQKIIDGKEQLEEIEKKSAESLTGTTFESFFDDYKSMLLDMDKSNQEFAESFGEYLRKAILENLIANKYRQDIQNLYDAWVKASDTNGDTKFDLDDKEADDLKNMEKELTDKILAERDALADAFGWTDSAKEQEASRGFGTEMTHEDAGELSGRFTALQITGDDIKTQSIEHTRSLNILTLKADVLLSTNVEMKNIADDTRSIIANSYLELVQISENTGAIVRPIQQMQKDMEEVKRNTSRL